MKHCTRGIQRSPEVRASINAQSVHTFSLYLRTTIHASGRFTCTGKQHLSGFILIIFLHSDTQEISQKKRMGTSIPCHGYLSFINWARTCSRTYEVFNAIFMVMNIIRHWNFVDIQLLRRSIINQSGPYNRCIAFLFSVNLWDARHSLLDTANITFETTTACVCLQSCTCAVYVYLTLYIPNTVV